MSNSKGEKDNLNRKKWIIMMLLVILAIFLIYYSSYKIKIKPYYNHLIDFYKEDSYPLLSQDQVVQLGWAHPDTNITLFSNSAPKSSYLYQKEMSDSTIKIGCFGDSYTMGDELGFGFDYPSVLQQMLDSVSPNKFQVINFGTSGYGLGQCLLQYEYLKKSYPLDVIILNLFDHLKLRDNTFKYHEYVPLHGRYILSENDSIDYIPVIGDSRVAAIKKYYSIFPKNYYLRFDVKTPSFLKPITNNYIEYGYSHHYNPFYYYLEINKGKQALDEEIDELYRRLVKVFSKKVKELVVVSNDDNIASLVEGLEIANLKLIHSDLSNKSHVNKALYRMPHYHFSPIGSYDLASQIASSITDFNYSKSVYKFELAHSDNNSRQPTKSNKFIDSLCIALDDNCVMYLYNNELPNQSFGFTRKVNNQVDSISSLLMLSNAELNDLIFYPLSSIPDNLTSIIMNINYLFNEKSELDCGKLIYENKVVSNFISNGSVADTYSKIFWNNTTNDTLPGWIVEAKRPIKDVSIIIDNQQVKLKLISKKREGFKWTYRFVFPFYSAFRSSPNFAFNPAVNVGEQILNLNLYRGDSIEKIPFLSLKKIEL